MEQTIENNSLAETSAPSEPALCPTMQIAATIDPSGKRVTITGEVTPFTRIPTIEASVHAVGSSASVASKQPIKLLSSLISLHIDWPGLAGNYIVRARLVCPDQTEAIEAEAPLTIRHAQPRVLKRIGAFFLDGLLLTAICFALALILNDLAVRLGTYGRLVGAGLALLYFGYFNSRLGDQHSFGKRIFDLAIESTDGLPISFGRAVLRSLPVILVFLFNGWKLPQMVSSAWLMMLVSLVVFGLGGSIACLLIFNRRRGQSLHDLLARTRVVSNRAFASTPAPSTPKRFVNISAGIGVLALALGALIAGMSSNFLPVSAVEDLYQAFVADPRFQTVSIDTKTFNIPSGPNAGSQAQGMVISACLPEDPGEAQRYATAMDISQTVAGYPLAASYDVLVVDLCTAFDLLFVSGGNTWRYIPPSKNATHHSVINLSVWGLSTTLNLSSAP